MPKISLYKNWREPDNPELYDILEHLENERDGKWQDLVHELRDIQDYELQKEFKSYMPTASFSGEFSYRANDKIKKHSGYLAIDLDDVENVNIVKSILMKDRYTFACFISCGGKGLRWIIRIVGEKHHEAFKGAVAYLYDEYGLQCVDINGSNVSKPYIVTYDPRGFINYNEVPQFKKYVKEKAEKKLTDFVHTTSDFDMILKQITGRGINLCEDYKDWLKIGFALVSQFGVDGEAAYHEISRMSQKYTYEKTKKQYKYCLQAKKTGVTITSFYYMAKTAGVNIVSEQTKVIVRYTRNGKKSGLSKEAVIKNLKELEGIEGVDQVVSDVFESNNFKEADDEESILHLLELFITSNYSLKMNEVTGHLEQNGNQLTPSDLNSIFIAAKKIAPKLDYQLLIRLLKSDFIEVFNPFFKFFGSDGIPVELSPTPEKDQNSKFKSPLIDQLAKTIKNDNPAYTSYFLRKWMVSIVSAAHKVHSPLLFCLLGGQGTGKTEWFRRLCPKELNYYYAESKLDKEKDDELLMTENLIIMDDELGGKSKQETLKLNNLTSKQWYSLRRPYGDHNEKILRLAVLCGTSNYYSILNDPTGNRRIIPIIVKDIDKELYNTIDKRQLFLEAFRLYKEGFDWRITYHDISYLNRDKEKFEAIIKEREIVQRYYEPGEDYRLTTTDIQIEIEMLTRQKVNAIVLGRELETLGFVNKNARPVGGGQSSKRWFVNKIGRSIDQPGTGDGFKPNENKDLGF